MIEFTKLIYYIGIAIAVYCIIRYLCKELLHKKSQYDKNNNSNINNRSMDNGFFKKENDSNMHRASYHRNYREDNFSSRQQAHRTAIVDEKRTAPYAIIYQSEFDYISRCILDYPNIETGGQLFGFLTEYGVPVVCYALGPGPRSNHQTAFFNQDTDYLQMVYNEINRRYGLRYIGEWHSHHQLGLAKPSGHDASTIVHGMERSSFRHFLLCIGNCDRGNHSTLNAFTFHINDVYNYRHAPWDIIKIESPYRRIIDNELASVLCHPNTRVASHGSNYFVNRDSCTPVSVVPDYSCEYWLNSKANNTVLKQIIDFVSSVGENASVKAQLDERKHVHLFVNRATVSEHIVFGEKFPNEPPIIISDISGGLTDNIQWVYNGDIFNSFKEYYLQVIRLQ